MEWVFYSLEKIPDLSLAKYQSLEETGVEGVLEKHSAFLRQWQRVSIICNVGIHLFIQFLPQNRRGTRTRIYLGFSYEETNLKKRIGQLMKNSPISDFFQLQEKSKDDMNFGLYDYRAIIKKYERKRITEDESHITLYTVEGWESRENARLYDTFRSMEALEEEVVYCVSLYGTEAYEKAQESLEKPVNYLRKKVFGKEGGVQLSKQDSSRVRDAASEDALKCYEDLLNMTITSPCFHANIKVFAQSEITAQLMLNAAGAEAIDKGNCQIMLSPKARYHVLPDKNECDLYVDSVPDSLSFWPTLFSLEEIEPFFRLPALYDGEHIELQKETAPLMEQNGIYLGDIQQKNKAYLSLKALTKHVFVCGVPGSGKTNTMLHIANSLWHNEEKKFGKKIKRPVPFLILEPAKREYRELSLFDIPELLIFSPSANTRFPFCINPFEFPKGLTLSEHIVRLCQVFEGVFPMQPPAPFVLDRSIEAVYSKHGWNASDINDGEKPYPTVSDLYAEFERQLLETSYDSEIQGNIRSVLEMRIGSLIRREKKEIFDVAKSIIEPEEWLKRPIILELESLGKETGNFVTLLVCVLIRETLKVNPMDGIEIRQNENDEKEFWKPLRHVIFIEEAHNLIASQNQMDATQELNPKIAATECIVDMLKEVRALREGMIIADQLPTAMAMDVIKNTNIKIVHRLTSGDDRGLVGSTMSANEIQIEQVASYMPGQTLMIYEGLLRPFELQVCNLEQHGNETPDDDTLYELMKNKLGQREIYQRFEYRKWMALQNRVLAALKLEQANKKGLESYEFETRSMAQREAFFEQCFLKYQALMLMRQTCQSESEMLSEQFVDKGNVEKTRQVIENIGQLYLAEVQKYIQIYL